MSNIQNAAHYSAQAMAQHAAVETDANLQGVAIHIKADELGDLYYVIWSVTDGKIEKTQLLCSATTLPRLVNHVAGFIANKS